MYTPFLNNAIEQNIPVQYNQLVELQNAIDNSLQTNLPQGAWKQKYQPPQWNQIIAKTEEILTTQSKDLQVFFMWMQASIACRGLKAILPTILEYKAFKKIFKQTESTELLTQKADIILAHTIKDCSILPNANFSYNDYLRAKHIEEKSIHTPNSVEFIAKELAKDKTIAFFTAEKHLVNAKIFGELIQAIELIPHLEESVKIIKKILKLINIEVQEVQEKEEEKKKSITTQRAQAYEQLREISAFLIKNEPHAFTGYILQKLAAMENASLAESLKSMPEIANLIK